MAYLLLFVSDYRIKIYIFNTLETIPFHKGICLFQFFDQHLGLQPFRIVDLTLAQMALLGKSTGTWQETKRIGISPGNDIFLTNQLHGANQLHPLKIRAVKLWHHCLNLRTI